MKVNTLLFTDCRSSRTKQAQFTNIMNNQDMASIHPSFTWHSQTKSLRQEFAGNVLTPVELWYSKYQPFLAACHSFVPSVNSAQLEHLRVCVCLFFLHIFCFMMWPRNQPCDPLCCDFFFFFYILCSSWHGCCSYVWVIFLHRFLQFLYVTWIRHTWDRKLHYLLFCLYKCWCVLVFGS